MKIKYVKDYVDEVHKKFPELKREEINKILLHGFKSYFSLNNFGGDVLFKDDKNKFLMYTGFLYKNYELYYKYSLFKQAVKLRVFDRWAKNQWDGYYYFGMTDEMYKFYESQEDEEVKIYENIMLFRLLDELKTYNQYKHYFKVKYPEYKGYKFFLENYETSNAEYIYRRSSNGYEPITHSVVSND